MVDMNAYGRDPMKWVSLVVKPVAQKYCAMTDSCGQYAMTSKGRMFVGHYTFCDAETYEAALVATLKAG